MTDKQLYKLCKKYGLRAISARRKFAGLLPEVARRELWRRRGFGGIYEFAARLGGLSRDQVDQVLLLEKRFVEIPVLHKALIGGEVSPSKLERIAAVANSENAEQLLEMVQKNSYATLNIKVQELREISGLNKPDKLGESLCAQTLEWLGISVEIAKKLLDLNERGVEINQLLAQFLQEREEKIIDEKLALDQLIKEKAETDLEQYTSEAGKYANRYIPMAVKRVLKMEFGDKCSRPNCWRLARQIHHKNHFAIGGSNSPFNLEPLCRGHHELEHK